MVALRATGHVGWWLTAVRGETAGMTRRRAQPPTASGVLLLPSGGQVRGRSLRRGPARADEVDWGLHLAGRRPAAAPWPARWVRWPDFWLPTSADDARDALEEALARITAGQRVEVACPGGVGRTGTALSALLVLQGVPAEQAVRTVRAAYHPRAVETPWQRRWLARLVPPAQG